MNTTLSRMEFCVKIVNDYQSFTIVTTSSVLDVAAVPDPPLDTQGLVIRLFIFLQALFSKQIVNTTVSISC